MADENGMLKQVALGTTLLLTGCFRPVEVPPPPLPRAELPAIQEDPKGSTAPGTGRIVLDVVGMTARVEEITETSRQSWASVGPYLWSAESTGETTRALCITPCAVDLPIGLHRLRFTTNEVDRGGEIEIQVTSKPRVYRIELGYERSRSNLLPGIVYGMSGILAAAGLVIGLTAKDSEPRTVGYATFGIGAGIFAITVLVDYLTRGEVRKGSYVTFAP
jgi:hypothetical protein